MGMVVRTNTMALNAYRQLGMNNSAVAKSLEKLSSGFRINRAGDDAAGLAISEKMKAQITGLETASANAQDGISLIQTAEGNLNEVHDMLNRMVELATKSANGTYTSTERRALQDEVDQLLTEIDRISQSANFNGTKLLNGTMGLNNEAFEIGKSTDYFAGGNVSISGQITTESTHYSTFAQQVKPKFTVDFADYEAKVAAGSTTTTDTDIKVGFTVNGQTLQAWDAATTAWTDISVTITAAAQSDITLNSTNVGAGQQITNNTNYKIGNGVYKATVNGTEVSFEWVGAADTTKTGGVDTSAKVTAANSFKPVGKLAVVTTNGANSGAVTVTEGKRNDCPVYNVTDPVVGGTPHRAGVKFKLTEAMIKDGSKLKIGDTTFTFDASVAASTPSADNAGADVTIGIKGLSGNALVDAVTSQLSHLSVSIKTAAEDRTNPNTAVIFNIGRAGTDTSTIELEAKVGATGNNEFSEADLKAAFSLTGKEAMANTALKLTDNSKVAVGDKVTLGKRSYEIAEVGATATETLQKFADLINSDTENTDVTASVSGDQLIVSAKTKNDSAPVIAGSGLTLQIGDTADEFNKMNVKVADMSTNGLSLAHLKNTGIMNETNASKAIDTIKKAINTVSSTRAGMGALQNRLEHTINNLDVAAENLSSANSRIRDTDMAKEMMNYTKMNVLVQSAQAMLAQANQQPQSVLQLLQ